MNPYASYESSLKLNEALFKPPVLMVEKQSCEAVEETCIEIAQVEENAQASDVSESGEDATELSIMQRNSVISCHSPMKIAADLETRTLSSPESNSTDSGLLHDCESSAANSVSSTGTKTDVERLTYDATTGLSKLLFAYNTTLAV